MDGTEFITTAKALAANADEGSLRSAVSRAYYGCYIHARHILRQLGFKWASTVTDHGQVWGLFQNCGDRDIQKAGWKLANLHAERRRADYDMDTTKFTTPSNVQLVITQADDIMLKFSTWSQPPVKGLIVGCIQRQYDLERGHKK